MLSSRFLKSVEGWGHGESPRAVVRSSWSVVRVRQSPAFPRRNTSRRLALAPTRVISCPPAIAMESMYGGQGHPGITRTRIYFLQFCLPTPSTLKGLGCELVGVLKFLEGAQNASFETIATMDLRR